MGIPPTGKEVSVPFIITYRIAEGKIVQHWMSFDRMALMEQLGVAPT
jgi:predicted ester cyclase